MISIKLRLLLPVSLCFVFCTAYADSRALALSDVNSQYFDSLKIADNATLPAVKRVYVNSAPASFAPLWISEFSSQTTKYYRAMILESYATALYEAFIQELKNNNWQILDHPDETGLMVNLKLHNIYINGPEKHSQPHVLVNEIGKLALQLSVFDVNNQLFFEIQDSRHATGITGSFIETDNAINFTRFQRLMSIWASTFTAHINEFIESP